MKKLTFISLVLSFTILHADTELTETEDKELVAELQETLGFYYKALENPELKKIKIDPEKLAIIKTELKAIFEHLDKRLDEKIRNNIANNGITIVYKYHHGLGAYLRNNYGLWSGKEPLGKALHEIGIEHADRSSTIILNEYWRHVNQAPSKLRAELAVNIALTKRMKNTRNPEKSDDQK